MPNVDLRPADWKTIGSDEGEIECVPVLCRTWAHSVTWEDEKGERWHRDSDDRYVEITEYLTRDGGPVYTVEGWSGPFGPTSLENWASDIDSAEELWREGPDPEDENWTIQGTYNYQPGGSWEKVSAE